MILNEQKPPLDEALVHFGVKGMKWGVRKNRTTDQLDKSERQAAKQNMKTEGREVVGALLERQFLGKGSLADVPYSRLSEETRTIRAGAEFYRATPRKNEVFRTRTYVSTNEEDRNRYNAVMPSLSGKGGKKGYKIHYEQTLKLTKDLTLPSEKARIDAFNDIMNSKSMEIKTVFGKTKEVTGREYLVKTGHGRAVKRYDDALLGKLYFDRMNSTASFDSPMNTAYFKNLQSKGFNALQDDNDKGILSRDPIILLNPNNTVKTTAIRQLTARDINNAQIKFTAPTRERR